MKNIQEQIELVKNDIFNRFPNCAYTVIITLWDDDTYEKNLDIAYKIKF